MQKFLAENEEWHDFGREIIPAAIKCCNAQAHVFNGYWEDIGTVSAFYRANLDMTMPLPKFNFFDADAPIYTRARYLPPSKLQECEVRDSIISEGCIVTNARIQRSIIGLRSRIQQDTRIEDTIIMGADFYQTIDEMRADFEAGNPRIGIGKDTVIRRAIIDKNARIGANVRLVNEHDVEDLDSPDQNYYIRDHIIIVPKNATVKDGTVV